MDLPLSVFPNMPRSSPAHDAEHDALYSIRETLAELSTDPNARRD